jgi:UDP-N-acetylmuramoylalanine--D-glutamate ligase
MEEYVADKRLIYAAQGPQDWTIARADAWGRSFLAETPARAASVADGRPAAKVPTAAYLEGLRGRARLEGADEEVLPATLSVRGEHMRRNLLAAALGARVLGFPSAEVRHAAATFGGIDHRLEAVRELDGVTFYNDSAATIPEATLEAVGSFDRPVRLIAGGSDKNIDFSLFARIAPRVAGLYLLDGTALDAIAAAAGDFDGPFSSLSAALDAAVSAARAGEVVLLSPGCASFGMFQNEFDRGRTFRDLVRAL